MLMLLSCTLPCCVHFVSYQPSNGALILFECGLCTSMLLAQLQVYIVLTSAAQSSGDLSCLCLLSIAGGISPWCF